MAKRRSAIWKARNFASFCNSIAPCWLWGEARCLSEDNRQLLQSASNSGRGKVVWLKASPETLHKRIGSDESTAQRRPKLTADGGLQEVRQLLALREPFYHQCADLEIDTENKSAG